MSAGSRASAANDSSATATATATAASAAESRHGDQNDMEHILKDIGGSYGRFQIFNYILFSVSILISGFVNLAYVFTTLNLDFR